jgi:hypothetical protein
VCLRHRNSLLPLIYAFGLKWKSELRRFTLDKSPGVAQSLRPVLKNIGVQYAFRESNPVLAVAVCQHLENERTPVDGELLIWGHFLDFAILL